MRTVQRPLSPCPLLPLAPETSDCSLSTPHWTRVPWLPIARHPPGATWKACSSPPASTRPEHQNSGGTQVFPHLL
ncbi:mCG1044422 [Mus musculus]|nr:mCG1044422 [Mus musculus]